MSKITQYLNEHLLGEVTDSEAVRRDFSHDRSVLKIKPEVVINPRDTNDVRKVARFCWQLAEKGHIMPVTVRGSGSSSTGAAIGKGIIVNTIAHLNNILAVSSKVKDLYVHVQPGVNVKYLNDALITHGVTLPVVPYGSQYKTIGGVVADNSAGMKSSKYANIGECVKKLEIVLSNGDLIETSRLSRHELNKKKGLQTFEGEIYRKIDGLIDDNQALINDKIVMFKNDNTYYSGISKVKERNGSFDLTPLFVGSQGTLGIMTEMVIRTEIIGDEGSCLVASFNDPITARTAADEIMAFNPTELNYIDGELLEIAASAGKKYPVYVNEKPEAVLFINFADSSSRHRSKKIKKTMKLLNKFESRVFTDKDYSKEELRAIDEVGSIVMQMNSNKEVRPPIIDGAAIVSGHREMLVGSIKNLVIKDHVSLPMYINWVTGVMFVYPSFDLGQVSDRQRIFKLMNDYYALVSRLGGDMAVGEAEGRLRANSIHGQLDQEVVEFYDKIRTVFDPYGTMNPGVKQKSDLKGLISQLDIDYDGNKHVASSPLH